MWRDTVLVAGKDLRIELRSRVVMQQVVPVAVLVLVLFAFALGPDRAPMAQAAPGLFWVAVRVWPPPMERPAMARELRSLLAR